MITIGCETHKAHTLPPSSRASIAMDGGVAVLLCCSKQRRHNLRTPKHEDVRAFAVQHNTHARAHSPRNPKHVQESSAQR